jgi:repressor LexA
MDGDLLAVHSQQQADNGQIVVARIDDEVTVKRFHRDGPKVCLLPENDEFSPIKIDLRLQTLVIEGIAVGLLRNQKLL